MIMDKNKKSRFFPNYLCYVLWWVNAQCYSSLSFEYYWVVRVCIYYLIPGHSIWKRMPWGEAEIHFFSYTNDQVLYNQFSPYFLCRVSLPLTLPIITNLGSLSQLDWMSISSKAFPSITIYVVYGKYSITKDKESMG